MIYQMTVEETLVRAERVCAVAAAALEKRKLKPTARDGLIVTLEEVVILLTDVRGTLSSDVLNLPLVQAA